MDSFLHDFEMHFNCIKDKKIILYGLGKNTENILSSSLPEKFRFIGLLDENRTEGEFMGFPVLDFQKITNREADAVIIVARTAWVRIIYNRIRKHAEEENIPVYSPEGLLLGDAMHEKVEHPYFEVGPNLVKHFIDTHEVISFDVFDTLLMRKVLLPTDVFYMVAIKANIEDVEKFAEYRIAAERSFGNEINPKLRWIYEKTDASVLEGKTLAEMENIELETDIELILPRKEVVSLFEYACSLGKKVYLTTDTYYSKEQIEQILRDNDIFGFEEVIISCEYGCKKENGLFNILRQKAGGHSIGHIGDNEMADIFAGEKYGLDVFRVYSAFDLLNISSYAPLAALPQNVTERNVLGIIISQMFRSPFALYQSDGRVECDDLLSYGKMFMAPVCVGFLKYIQEKCRPNEKILLAARDGYILNRIFPYFDPEKKYDYLYFQTSRSASVGASVSNRMYLKFALQIGYSGEKKDILRERFGLDLTYEDNEEEVFNAVNRQSAKLCENYMMYINKLQLTKQPVFVDLVSSGTTQVALENILQRKLYGIYLMRIKDMSEIRKEMSIDSFIPDENVMEKGSYIGENFFLLEKVFSSPMPTIRCFGEMGEPVYYSENRTERDILLLEKLHKGIEQYAKEYHSLLRKDLISWELVDMIYKSALPDMCIISDEVKDFYSAVLRDEYCNRQVEF